MTGDYVPDAGDLIWTDFDPTVGREHNGRRPALVVSGRLLAEMSGFALVCPITSRVRPFPTSVVLPDGLPVAGEVLLTQVRGIDLRARVVRFAGAAVPAGTASAVRAKLAALTAI